MNMTAQAQWTEAEKALVPKGASAVQSVQSQLCFYAGIEATMKILDHMFTTDLSEEAGTAVLQGIRDECARFARNHASFKGLPQSITNALIPGAANEDGPKQ